MFIQINNDKIQNRPTAFLSFPDSAFFFSSIITIQLSAVGVCWIVLCFIVLYLDNKMMSRVLLIACLVAVASAFSSPARLSRVSGMKVRDCIFAYHQPIRNGFLGVNVVHDSNGLCILNCYRSCTKYLQFFSSFFVDSGTHFSYFSFLLLFRSASVLADQDVW